MGMIGNTLAQGLISGANIQDGTVDTPDLKDSAVTAAKIATGTITPNKLSTGALTWDSSGNHCIGGTPSAWGSSNRNSLELGPGSKGLALTSDSPAEGRVMQNVYFNGTNWIYSASYGASGYRQTQGEHQWFTATAGTAGATAALLEQMRLTTGGNLKLNGGAIESVSGNAHSLRFYQNSTNYANGAASWAIFGAYNDGTMYITRYGGNSVNQTPADIVEIKGNGDVKVNTGNLVIGTAGKGIDFSADGNASGATSELLDDYEEGTFTPFAAGSTTGTGSYIYQAGRYTKIGRVCIFQITIGWSGHTGSGNMYIGGLPFTALGGDGSITAGQSVASLGYNNGLASTDHPVMYVGQGSTALQFSQTTSSGSLSGISVDSVVGELIINGHYIVA